MEKPSCLMPVRTLLPLLLGVLIRWQAMLMLITGIIGLSAEHVVLDALSLSRAFLRQQRSRILPLRLTRSRPATLVASGRQWEATNELAYQGVDPEPCERGRRSEASKKGVIAP